MKYSCQKAVTDVAGHLLIGMSRQVFLMNIVRMYELHFPLHISYCVNIVYCDNFRSPEGNRFRVNMENGTIVLNHNMGSVTGEPTSNIRNG